MAAVEVLQVKVENNPATFESPFRFEITYEVREPLQEGQYAFFGLFGHIIKQFEDIEWKVIYVSSAEDESLDQVLDEVLLPADKIGRFQFTLDVPAPNAKLFHDDLLGVTAVLITCSYKEEEFIRIGYYLNNEYDDASLQENPPTTLLLNRIQRRVFAEEPRVTRFLHPFDSNESYREENSQHSVANSIVI
eukprot:jgi/Galph1/5692/GphlegSOOS_G4375.1